MVRNIAKLFPVDSLTALAAAFVCCLLLMPGWLHALGDEALSAESIAMSPDGKYMAVKYGNHVNDEDRNDSSYDSGIWIYDLDDLLSPPHYLRGAHYYDTLIAISPDSRYISLAEYQQLEIFDLEDYSLLLKMQRTATEKPLDLSTVVFSPDGKSIKFLSDWWATSEHEMSIWDIDTGSRVLSIPAVRAGQSRQLPKLSPDWRQFLDWWHSDGLQINELDTRQGLGSPLGIVSINASDVRGIAFSPDSSLFGLVIPDDEIKIFRTDTWELTIIQVLGQYSCGNSDATLAFGHINPWIILSCHTFGCGSECEWYGGLLVLDFETGSFLMIQNRAPSFDYITPDDGLLIGDNSGRISIWDTQNGFELSDYPGTNPQVHPKGELMASIGPDGAVWLWNIKSKELLGVLPVPQQQTF